MKPVTVNTNSALVADNSQGSGLSMEALMAMYEMPSAPSIRSLVTGEVVATVRGGFLVDIGLKSDCVVRDAAAGELEVGKSYEFYVCDEGIGAFESDGLELSLQRAKAWTQLKGSVESKTIVTAQVHADPRRAISRSHSDRVGGLIAFVNGVKCFIPRREIPQRCRLESLVGQEIPVTVLSADPSAGRTGSVVLSHNSAIEVLRQKRLEELNTGDIVNGRIVAIIEAGLLVEVGGELTGLVPRSEVSGDRTGNAMARFQRGQEVTVKVLSVNLAAAKITLSVRAARAETFLPTLTEGMVVSGVVARFEQYGAFVCLDDCIDGLLHNADHATLGGRREKFTAGQTIEVEVLSIDREKGRVGLSRRSFGK
jgi:ribosomal protein S1